ncbi:MAG: DUF885 family protein [Alphaproteobacteria bacterium]|nr:DUF885 family protein [Alphaproteobacteria bacterium]
MLRTSIRVVGVIFLLAVVAGGYWTYRLVWGKPFNFDHLIDRQGIETLMDDPQLLTGLGIIDGTWLDFHSDKLTEFSLARRNANRERIHRFAEQIKEYDRSSLTPQQQTTYDIMLWTLDAQSRFDRFDWLTSGGLYPFDQLFGEHTSLPRFMQFSHSVYNEKTAKNYVARLNAFGTRIDQVLAETKRQAAAGVLPPRFVIDHVIKDVAKFREPAPPDHPLVTTFKEKLAKIDGFDKAMADQLAADAAKAVKDVVYPAYERIQATFEGFAPHATDDDGVWKLPDGDAYYAARLHQMTTTDLTPDEVHNIGLQEVARIEREIDAGMKAVGLTSGTIVQRFDQLSNDPRFTFSRDDAGREQILAGYRQILDKMREKLPTVFSHVPPQPLEVQRVPTYAEAASAGAYYNRASFDGRRPGTFFANLRDPHETQRWSMPTLAYHEGIPGHHLQISWAQNIKGVPFARKVLPFTAYVEGWALYAERLAKEMGMYDNDPYGDLGRLQAEMFRAVRLVVDTGIHAKHWTRAQAIAYMREKTGMVETDVTSEVERYIVSPGQACAYKIGMLKILELRERAKNELGARFDLKAFHDVVLDGGAMPLTVLERRVNDWIAETKAQG